jgi:hypothetical protein
LPVPEIGQPPAWNFAAALRALPTSRVLLATNSGATTLVGLGAGRAVVGAGSGLMTSFVGLGLGVTVAPGVGEVTAGPVPGAGEEVVGEPRH